MNNNANKKSQDSEKLYRMLFHCSMDGIILTDSKDRGKILSINLAACRMLGWTEEELIGKEQSVMFDLQDPALFKLLDGLAYSRSARVELTCRRKDGTTFPGEVTAFFIDDNRETCTVIIFRDITERKQAEKALNHKRSLLKSAMQVTDFMLAFFDPQFNFLWVNPAYAKASKMKPEELVGKNHFALYPNPENEAIFRKVRNTGKGAFYKDKPFIYPDQPEHGVTYWDWSLAPVKDSEGKVTGLVLSLRETTKYKQIEEALRESEARLQIIVANSPDVILEQDRDLRYVWIYNLSPGLFVSDVIGKTDNDLLPPDKAKQLESIKRQVLEKGKHEQVFLELFIDGKPQCFEAFYEPRYDAAGQIAGVLTYTRDVTDRKQMEKKLQESEEKYRNIVETDTEGIWIGDPEAKTIYVNKRMAEMLGYTPDEMIGRYAWDFTDEEGKPIIKMKIDKRRQGIDENYEFKFVHKDGSPLLIIVSSKSLFDKAGKFTGSMSMLTDITGRKEAETRLKETLDNLEKLVKERTAELEKAYKSLEESKKGLADAQKMAHIGNWSWDLKTGEVYWSEEMYRIFGRNPQKSGATLDELLSYIHSEDRDYMGSNIRKGLSIENRLSGKIQGMDYRIVLADGEERIVHAESKVIFDKENYPLQVRGIVQDITESKKTEEKLQHAYSRSRTFFSLKIDGIGIIIGNMEGEILEANDYYLHMLGYSREEFEAGNLSWLEITPSEWLPADEKAIAELQEYGFSTPFEKEYIRKDGSRVTALIASNMLPESQSEVLSFALDITERKRTEEALVKLEKIRIKEIHHRIKNNLQVISSLLDLQAEIISNLEVCEIPDIVEAFKESQTRVISMALIHEKLYEGDKFDTFDFAAYLKKLTAKLFSSYNLGNKDISFKLDLEQADLGMDTAIPLGMIVNELVSNSFKHAFPDRQNGEIRIILRRDEASAVADNSILNSDKGCMGKSCFNYRLEVSDNGKGIPEDIDFENSATLGLQIINLLVEQIDGYIELRRDQGTEFTIWFNNIEERANLPE